MGTRVIGSDWRTGESLEVTGVGEPGAVWALLSVSEDSLALVDAARIRKAMVTQDERENRVGD